MPDESEDICGETYDHDEKITFTDATLVMWECYECGAEGEDYLDS